MAHIEEGYTKAGFVADLLPDGERFLQVGERRLVVALGIIDLGNIVERGAFPGFVADLLLIASDFSGRRAPSRSRPADC